MNRYVGVKIIHPRLQYAGLVRLDRAQQRQRRFAAVSENQTEAEVEVHLLEQRGRGRPRSVRLLHSCMITGLEPTPDRSGELIISGNYDGSHYLDIEVLLDGHPVHQQRLAVDPVPRRMSPLVPAAVALVAVLGLGLWLYLGSAGQMTPPAPAPLETRPARHPTAEDDRPATAERLAADSPTAERPATADQPATDQTTVDQPPTATEEPAATDSGIMADPEPPPEPDSLPDPSPAAPSAPADVVSDDPPEDSPASPEPRISPAAVLDEQRTVYFTSNQTFLTRETQQELRELARLLRSAPAAEVTLVGHTAIFGTEPEQYEISRERAENVHRFLRDAGWEPEQPPAIEWQGPSAPITEDVTRQSVNRRVEIYIRSSQ
ncbi:OmpA family protein [Spirochaeta africana]|uniref:Outer membrane protein/peptidoglycan-associated (Lipo)protein n=1 Tax=Spirochaeta africana (strain ATCC 700263 / DSM 8902 / Z-7692) TaxID=889378 RepID=H9UHP1_SPIAZ|nr:OmpA family protein [Spirochaeta africana]AFG37034.1 outer membrane protein/peptidoglycan-associated (lipo)protein [Spirochaeta africana DSM 8902]